MYTDRMWSSLVSFIEYKSRLYRSSQLCYDHLLARHEFIVPGFDPALPGFNLAGPGSRISSGDAKYVEIIHTNGGLLGFLAAIGDVDFYPNGGQKQLGCLLDVGGACSHARSFRFYAESINTHTGFHGKSCSTFIRFKLGLCKNEASSIMGGHKPLFSARGNYYLMTKPSSPFASGQHQLAMRR